MVEGVAVSPTPTPDRSGLPAPHAKEQIFPHGFTRSVRLAFGSVVLANTWLIEVKLHVTANPSAVVAIRDSA